MKAADTIVTSISGGRATKSRGRPLAARTIAVREAILDLTDIHDRMTVRGIFYALVGKNIVPKDETTGYRIVQRQVLALRRENLIPWAFVSDGTRWVRQPETFTDADDALLHVAQLYRRDLWREQGHRVEIWLEKDTLADLISPITYKWGVPLYVSRGVPSATYVHNAAVDARDADRRTTVFALYDYDAGGDRACRTIRKGFDEFAPDQVDVQRLALTTEQVVEWNLPTRPAKRTDPEAAKWGGKPSVELDSVAPDQLCDLVEEAVVNLIDPHAWQVAQAIETEERDVLRSLIEGRAS